MKREAFIDTMEDFLGVKEYPPGSNLTAVGVEFGWNGVPWCAETVSCACKRLGFPLHEAAVIRIEQHAKARDWGMGWTGIPTLGAAVCFDWNGRGNPADMHTGVVTEVLSSTRFRTIEGNYQNRCDRVLRDTKYVRGFATFPFESEVNHVEEEFHLVAAPGVAEIAKLKHPDGGVAILMSDGGVKCWFSPYDGNVLGKDYMKPDHHPARLAPNPRYAPGNGKPWYIVIDQHGHEYGHDGFG